jgi:uncharacterized membrane protein YozB (DUF420 family)
MAFALAATVFVGFAPTYYLVGLNDASTPVLTPRLHVHAGLSTAWIALLIVQTQFIAAGRRDLHKMLGFAGAAVALATVITGIMVALASERRVHTAANAGSLMDPYVFLIFPAMSIGLFAVFVGLAILKRNRPDTHKRLMLLGTISLIGPALARLVTLTVKGLGMVGLPGVVGAVLLMNVFIAAIAVRDFRTRGSLHPATLWGGGFFVVSEPLRFAIGFSEPWQAFARAVMG